MEGAFLEELEGTWSRSPPVTDLVTTYSNLKARGCIVVNYKGKKQQLHTNILLISPLSGRASLIQRKCQEWGLEWEGLTPKPFLKAVFSGVQLDFLTTFPFIPSLGCWVFLGGRGGGRASVPCRSRTKFNNSRVIRSLMCQINTTFLTNRKHISHKSRVQQREACRWEVSVHMDLDGFCPQAAWRKFWPRILIQLIWYRVNQAGAPRSVYITRLWAFGRLTPRENASVFVLGEATI